MKRLADCLLYAFVDTAYLAARAPIGVAQALCDGGADLIQLRAKDATVAEIQRLAESIFPVTKRAGVGLVINDHPEIAREMGAPFCHLGQEDFFATGLRHVNQWPAAAHGIQFGLSSHAPAQAQRAVAAGAAYVAVGPVFATGTKPDAKPVTLEYVRWAAANLTIPWFAIGGINLQNLDEVLEAGARGICVVSAILTAADLRLTCEKFKNRLLCARRTSSRIVNRKS